MRSRVYENINSRFESSEMVDTYSFDVRSSNSYFKSSEPDTPPPDTVDFANMPGQKVLISKFVRHTSP
jgi:hypothetical protein